MSFNPEIISVDSITEGDLLSQRRALTFFIAGDINNTTGSINGVVGTITASRQSVFTAGTFATVNFTAGAGNGISDIILNGVVIGDRNGQPVPISVINSQVTVGQPSAGSGGGAGPRAQR